MSIPSSHLCPKAYGLAWKDDVETSSRNSPKPLFHQEEKFAANAKDRKSRQNEPLHVATLCFARQAWPPGTFIGIATCSGFGKWEAPATKDIRSRWQLFEWVPRLPSMDKSIKSCGISKAPAACISLVAKEAMC